MKFLLEFMAVIVATLFVFPLVYYAYWKWCGWLEEKFK